jgi:MFS family permease
LFHPVARAVLLLTGQMLPHDRYLDHQRRPGRHHRIAACQRHATGAIVALYGVAFAVCLAMGSKLGDNYGRRRLFMGRRALASLRCCAAWRTHQRPAGRPHAAGAGAALIVPQILATLHVTLKGPAHARAISLYGGIGGIAFIVGQMGGGWLVSADIAGLGWRNAFLSMCRSACWCWP